jgi:hypothetical protein
MPIKAVAMRIKQNLIPWQLYLLALSLLVLAGQGGVVMLG